MASLANANIIRRNIKLESFLQRTLTEEEFSCVRAYAPCVVDSASDRFTFRHVVLTDKVLYLTQHPPKSIYEAAKVAEIADIKLVHDDPWFLHGEDKEKCQHVQLLCKVSKGVINKMGWHSGHLSASEQDITGRSSSANSSPQTWRKIIKSFNLSSSRRNSDEMRTVDNNDNSSSGPSIPIPPSRESSGFSESIGSSPEFFHREINKRKITKVSSLPLDSSSSLYFPMRNIPSLDSGISECTDEAKDSFSPFSPLQTWSGNTASRFFKSQSALGFYHPHSHQHVSNGNAESHVRCHSTSTLLHRQNVVDLGSAHISKSISLEEESKKATVLLNFYILDFHPLFISSLFTIRSNYLIRATTALEDEVSDSNSSSRKNKGEVTEKLFDNLKREITAPQIGVEELFHLLQELKSAARKHFTVRSLFWKDSTLLQFLLEKLHYHFELLSNGSTDTEDELLSDCEDELQMIVLILETITAMFRETEIVLSRFKHLTANKNKVLREILSVVTTCTKIPSKYYSTSKRMLTSVEEFSNRNWENLPESELIKLMAEIVMVKLNMMFEILFALEQGNDEIKVIDMCNMIANDKEPLELYIHHTMTQIMCVLMNCYENQIRPRDAVQLYKCLYVLKHFLSHPLLEKIIWHEYNENFRYCVSHNPLSLRIPTFYPIKEVIMDMFNEINRIMCERKTSWNE